MAAGFREWGLGPARRGVAGGLLALCFAVAPLAAEVQTWQQAPLYGADIRSLAIDPRDPELVLAGTSAGHVYLSRDGGATWANAGEPLPLPGWVVGTLAFDPNRAGRVWAALWGIWGGGMVVHSDDLGKTWTNPHPVRDEEQVYTLATVPGARGRLFAATRTGVYRSEDDGASWYLVTAPYPQIVNVSSLWVDPIEPRTVIAGTWRRAYRSDDGGTTWRGIFDGMLEDSEVFTVQSVPWNRGELWASTCGWVYRTLDLGGKWQRLQNGLAERRTPSFAVLASGRLLAGTVAGVYVSDDQGQSWHPRSGPELAVLAVAEHPAKPGRVLIGTEGSGVWRSLDGGESFQPAATGMHNLRVMALAREGARVLAAVNHAGPVSGIYTSEDGGRSFARDPSPLPTILALAVADGRAWAATEGGLYERTTLGWRRVQALGTERIHDARWDGERLRVRTASGWLEQRGKEFAPTAASAADPGVRTAAASDGRPARARRLPTGDERHPALIIDGIDTHLLAAGGSVIAVDLPFPARDATAAAIVGDRLLVGSSGYGLQAVPLAQLRGESVPPEGKPVVAAPPAAGTNRRR